MPQRRDVLKLALGGIGGAVLLPAIPLGDVAKGAEAVDAVRASDAVPPQGAPASPPPSSPPPSSLPVRPPVLANPALTLAPPVPFTSSTVVELARELARQAFKPVSSDLPEPFRALTAEQYAAIRPRPAARIWADETLGFTVEPLHRGFQNTNLIQLHLVADGQSQRLVYETGLFDFGKLTPSLKIGDIGFAGFRVMRMRAGLPTAEIASFLGSNFYQALAPGQMPGLLARALTLKVADPKGEEMPAFRQLWIEKPSIVADLLVVHALIDSESLSGAFRFTIRPGEATIVDVECTLFARAALDNYGLASMSATHLLGFIDHKRIDDYRPNVCEVTGLQMLTGANEWVWRPVSNRDELQISTFSDSKPRGFGCLMRDRDFESYLDEEQHWERRPSLWVEPLGDWLDGGVQLIEIPSLSDANDNILCFWRPKAPLKAGSETSFAYRQFWCWDPPERPDLARTARSHSGTAGKRSRFFVEFEGDVLADEKRIAAIKVSLTATTGSITMMKTFAVRERKAYRVLFELDPQSAGSSELRLVLEAGGDRISETWLYRWTPA